MAYLGLLAVYALAAVGWLLYTLREAVPRWTGWASTSVDVLVVLAVLLLSSVASYTLFPVVFLLPIAVAFMERPAVTAAFGVAATVGYTLARLFYLSQDGDTVGVPDVIYTRVGLLLWVVAATTGLCYVLRRRSDRVRALLEVRSSLVAESMRADETRNRELAEGLHDGPLQELLAVRLELEELGERSPDPLLESARDTLKGTATQLRTVVTALHPQVLSEQGLTAALRELIRQHERKFEIDAELEEVGKPRSQSVLYRAARELLTNIAKHAKATIVTIRLARKADRIELIVGDDGVGLDPAALDHGVGGGHIGLPTLVARIEAMGGSMDISSEAGAGTRITVVSPPEP
ncbi:sensor histidine kinase [Micromonospora sp. WMMD736]|uniref:sensor histidine kinase n=1 Tax=Micromonospora sp. WMMD736 TaxID=3404112 RepID=UPI003B957FCC